MTSDHRRWNVPAVTSERFDDEVVIVNFDSGKYHSIQGDGVTIWQWLGSGPTVDQLVRTAQAEFTGDAAEIDRAVRAFVVTLETEHLIVPAENHGASSGLPTRVPGSPPAPFRTPALTTFSDMQELLWLDPIHEVDDTGWPVARNDAGN